LGLREDGAFSELFLVKPPMFDAAPRLTIISSPSTSPLRELMMIGWENHGKVGGTFGNF
jgi:hypothetical protein